MLLCGCEQECCGICVHAARAGRPRLLTRELAVNWEFPKLKDFRGAAKQADRNADGGEPAMWYWQMEGKRWPALDPKESRRTFDVATKAWHRLAASQEERSEETYRRYDRTHVQMERQTTEQQRVLEEEQRSFEARSFEYSADWTHPRQR